MLAQFWNRQAAVFGLALGCVGSFSLAIGFTSGGMSYHPDGWQWRVVHDFGVAIPRFPTATWLGLVGVVLLGVGWWLVRPRPERSSPVWLVAAFWLVPLLLVPPIMSGDAFLYADAGWLFGQGVEVYQTGLCAAPGPFTASVDPTWCARGAPYPPGAILMFWAAAGVTGFHPFWGAIMQRGISLAGWLLVAALLPRVAARQGMNPNWALWFALLNPFVIIHGIGGAHNDLFMAGLVVAALALSGPGWWLVWGAVMTGLAMSIKPQAGLAVVGVAGFALGSMLDLTRVRAIGQLLLRTLLATVIACATFVAVSMLSGLGFGWVKALSLPGSVVTMSPFFLLNDVVQHVQVGLALDATPYASWLLPWLIISLGLVFAVTSIRYVREPMRVLAWGSLLVVFGSQGLLMWYFILPAVLLSVVRLTAESVRWLFAGSLAYLFAYMLYFMFGWGIWVNVVGGAILGLVAMALTAKSRGLEVVQEGEVRV